MSGEANSKKSPERIEVLLSALRAGNTRRASAALSDIDHATFYRWLEDATFRDSVEKAEAEAEAFYLGAVLKAAADPKTWTAAAWWLERRKNADYARRDKVEMTVDLRKEAEQLAAEMGLDPAAVMAELDGILKAGTR